MTSPLSDWQVIDLAGAAEHEDLCEAALFYLLERMRLALEDPAEATRVKLMVVDEAWRYLARSGGPRLSRRGRKDLEKEERRPGDGHSVGGRRHRHRRSAEALLESMPTKLFLANPDLPASAASRHSD